MVTVAASRDPAAAAREVPVGRLKQFVRHVHAGLTAQPEPRAAARVRRFWMGFLVHMILVPSWVVPPAGLLAGLLAAGAPHGARGVLACLGLGGALAAGPPRPARALLCAAVMSIAGSGRRRMMSMFGAAVVSVLCFVVSVGDGWWPRVPWIFNFISRWAPHYYQEASLRGALKEIRPGGRNFFAWHPHGCLSAGWTINGTYNPDFMKHAGRTLWLIDDSLRRLNPGFRVKCEMYEAEDRAIESGRPEDFRNFMSRGETVCFIPGGFLDAVAFERGKDVTVLSSKKGFIKYCLQYGYRVTPVYTFGECDTFHAFKGLKSLRMQVAKRNIPALAFFGWPLMPMLPLTDSRIISYVGRAIELPHIPEPSAVDVDHWHGIYTAALRRLFEENKVDAGYPDAQLEIL